MTLKHICPLYYKYCYNKHSEGYYAKCFCEAVAMYGIE